VFACTLPVDEIGAGFRHAREIGFDDREPPFFFSSASAWEPLFIEAHSVSKGIRVAGTFGSVCGWLT